MQIAILQNEDRALLTLAATEIEQLPPPARRWLGPVKWRDVLDLADRTTVLGISTHAIIFDIVVHGYYALPLLQGRLVSFSHTPAADIRAFGSA